MDEESGGKEGGRAMRILYCIPHLYNSGGMERVLTQKVNWLAHHTEHELTIVTTEVVPEGMKETFFALDARIQVVQMNIGFDADYRKPLLSKWRGHQLRMRAYRRALIRFVKEHRIDLCISTGGKEIAFLHTLPCRTMAEMHFAMKQREQLLTANHSGAFWRLLGRIRTKQLVRAVKPLERLVVLTEHDKEDWQQAGCTNVVVIPNPCSMNGCEVPVLSKKNEVLSVGRLHEQKGFDMLLQAWSDVEKQHPEWTLRIVGEGPKRAALEEQIQALGLKHVELAGLASSMVNEYAAASLFVLSSRYEGLPLALIEAMWCGLPCVAFDCPHGPEELLSDGRGWLVKCEDIAGLSRQIAHAITHAEEAAECASRALTYARSTYAEQPIMEQWVRVVSSE